MLTNPLLGLGTITLCLLLKDAASLIGMTPNIQIDWKKSGSDRFSVPIGLGAIGLFRSGNTLVR
jgi:hypothetical protein